MKTTKTDLKELKRISKSLPDLIQFTILPDKKILHPVRYFYVTWPVLIEKYPKLAKAILRKALGKTETEEDIEPGGEHDVLFPHKPGKEWSEHLLTEEVIIFQNHFRALKRRFQKDGWKAIRDYVLEVRKKDNFYKSVLKEVASYNKENAS